jgi:hypothetical protein
LKQKMRRSDIQLSVLRRKGQGRVWLTNNDRWIFVQLYRWCPSILQVGRSSRDARALASAGIEMPPAVSFRPPVPQLLRDRRTKLQDPTADGLVADVQASRGQQILDVAVAQGEPQLEPNRGATDAGREAVANVRNGVHHHSYLIHRVTVTMPYI